MPEFLLQFANIDTELFELIHHRLKNPLFDVLMPILSHPFPYWKILAGLVWTALVLFGPKRWRLTFLLAVVAITLSDLLTNQFLKPLVHRPRPLAGRTFSFPSSHAANFFSAATYLILRNKRLWPLLILGFFVGYSRVYIGSHYPLDVLGGIALGVVSSVIILFLHGAIAKKIPRGWDRFVPAAEKTVPRDESTRRT